MTVRTGEAPGHYARPPNCLDRCDLVLLAAKLLVHAPHSPTLQAVWEHSPAAENNGIFWPRAMEFMTSIVEMPVWIISSG